ncbi:hypothetical protein ACVQ8P_04175 [Dellaglioa sp. BT-FLS60]
MSKTFKRVALLSFLGGSAYYVYMHKDELMTRLTEKVAQTKEDFSDYQKDINRLTNASKKMQDATDMLNKTVEQTLPIITSINDRIDKFSYEIQPNINKITKKLEQYQ